MDQQEIPAPDLPKNESDSLVKPDYFSFASKIPSPPPTPLQNPPPTPPTPSFIPSSPPISVAPKKPKIKPIFLIITAVVFLGITSLIIIFFPKINSFFREKFFLKKAPVTLTYWGLFEPSSVFQQIIDDYQKDHPGVKINYVQENLKEYRERLQAALERKEGPDIFRIHQSWVPMLGSLLASIPQTVYSSTAFEQTFYPSAKETLRYNGQYIAIPLMVDGLSLFYNEDIFRANGKSPPKTWGELKKVACELTVKDEQGKLRTAGVALGTTNNVDHWSDILGLMMLQNSADLANPAACTKNPGGGAEGESCLGRDALTFYTLFVTDRVCADEGTGVGSVWSSLLPTSTYAFAAGNVAMYFGPSWRVFDIKSINDKLNFKVISVPQLPGGVVNWSSYWAEGVSKNSKYQIEGWEFLRYLSSEKVLQKLYQTESSLRLFGEPYPRVDMAPQLKTQPMVGAFIEQAPFAKSWYLSSSTSDNGINKQIIKYYEDAVNAVNGGADPLGALKTTTQGVAQVLSKYGLTR